MTKLIKNEHFKKADRSKSLIADLKEFNDTCPVMLCPLPEP